MFSSSSFPGYDGATVIKLILFQKQLKTKQNILGNGFQALPNRQQKTVTIERRKT